MADISQVTLPSGSTFNFKDASARNDLSGKAPINSPTFTGVPTAPTAADGTNTDQIATTSFVNSAFKANDAMVFKGTIGTGGTVTELPASHYKGWTYKVITAGTYAGHTCEIGDMIICITRGTSASDAHWTVVQANVDGTVTGPVSSTNTHVAVFDGTSGKVIKDSGFTIGKSVPSDAKFTDTTYSVMTGAGASAAGSSGLVPSPSAGDQNKYLKGDGAWGTVNALPSVTSDDNGKVLEVVEGSWATGTKKIDKNYSSYDFEASPLSGLDSYDADYIWTDGENIYYSYLTNQYVLDKSTSSWVSKTWYGTTSTPLASYIWYDGENVYYSYGSTQYVLDKSTSTWSNKTWYGLTNFYRDYIWTDGERIYYSSGSTQYVLNKSTYTWSVKTWSSTSNFDGGNIWTDGENVYYSYGFTQYVLNKSTSTWSTKTWSGMTNFYKYHIWTDGENIYLSNGSGTNYVLNKSTSTWSQKVFTGVTSLYGKYFWSDGENTYYSKGNTQYIRVKDPGYVLIGTNGSFEKVPLPEFSETVKPSAMTGATAQEAGNGGLVPAPSAGDQNKVLKGDGTWGTVDKEQIGNFTGATTQANGESGLVPAPVIANKNKYLKGDGSWSTPISVSYDSTNDVMEIALA